MAYPEATCLHCGFRPAYFRSGKIICPRCLNEDYLDDILGPDAIERDGECELCGAVLGYDNECENCGR